ncbi:MAG: hypothetical protein ACWGQW_20435 [bacterium]
MKFLFKEGDGIKEVEAASSDDLNLRYCNFYPTTDAESARAKVDVSTVICLFEKTGGKDGEICGYGTYIVRK